MGSQFFKSVLNIFFFFLSKIHFHPIFLLPCFHCSSARERRELYAKRQQLEGICAWFVFLRPPQIKIWIYFWTEQGLFRVLFSIFDNSKLIRNELFHGTYEQKRPAHRFNTELRAKSPTGWFKNTTSSLEPLVTKIKGLEHKTSWWHDLVVVNGSSSLEHSLPLSTFFYRLDKFTDMMNERCCELRCKS